MPTPPPAALTPAEAQRWFEEHVAFEGQPYTLDRDQAAAVIDVHKNTLVTARAGSGKTRVIVAKVAYLVAHEHLPLETIKIFMFNRAAAAEVNQRIANLEIDGQKLSALAGLGPKHPLCIASTFHKFALDIVKLSGLHPQIIGDSTLTRLTIHLSTKHLRRKHLSPRQREEALSVISNFISRAGQKYPGPAGFRRLHAAVLHYRTLHRSNLLPEVQRKVFFHKIAFAVYRDYLEFLAKRSTPERPVIDFNILMTLATETLQKASQSPETEASATAGCAQNVNQACQNLRYIMVDEYQDFSYLFLSIMAALRALCPAAHLFAVGDDWQAINRFAGSDVNYFLEFAKFFPEDATNLPLATNYRSARHIVNYANNFMLRIYDPEALPARTFRVQKGKVIWKKLCKLPFNASDYDGDRLFDGRYIELVMRNIPKKLLDPDDPNTPTLAHLRAARLLKQLTKIIARSPDQPFLLLHRHNFTSTLGFDLHSLRKCLKILLVEKSILSPTAFESQIRLMTMHKSKGLECENVILLEFNQDIVRGAHPHATIFGLFGDTRSAEVADQSRLIYVALTRAKSRLFLITNDEKRVI